MCLCVPARIVRIDDENKTATVDVSGDSRLLRLDMLSDEVRPGDYLVHQHGFALNKVPTEEVDTILNYYREILGQIARDDEA